ncbi:MAG: UbiA family prenyltransferase [Gemmataceae bacterium]
MNAVARLVRLPALPSALSNITMAALAVAALPERLPQFLLLLLGSSCLYMAGMALNDWYDQDEDRRERPERPIASGEITSQQAAGIGFGLLGIGVLLAWLAGLLAGLIVLYNAVAKKGWLGPLVMGACRAVHVLLGCSLAGSAFSGVGPHLALVMGVYIVGVTWFARGEAGRSKPAVLLASAGVILAALLLALAVPAPFPPDTASPVFPYVLVVLGFVLALPIARAVEDPSPQRVQAAVRRQLLGVIVLDAALASATAGTLGLVVLIWLIPALLLAKRGRGRLSAT